MQAAVIILSVVLLISILMLIRQHLLIKEKENDIRIYRAIAIAERIAKKLTNG